MKAHLRDEIIAFYEQVRTIRSGTSILLFFKAATLKMLVVIPLFTDNNLINSPNPAVRRWQYGALGNALAQTSSEMHFETRGPGTKTQTLILVHCRKCPLLIIYRELHYWPLV